MNITALPKIKSTLRQWKRYSKYKDSGIPWLGQIPAEWQLLPLFAVFQEQKNKNEGNLEQNVLSLSYGKIVQRNVSDNFGLLPESFETYQIVQSGNIILRLTDLQNDKRSLRVGLVKEKGIITSAYVCLRIKGRINSDFGSYLLHSYDISKIFYSYGGGVRQSMKYEDLKWMPLPCPINEEQQAIVEFLDRETSKTDLLIKKKVQQIELLKEKRTALISHVVAKGLDPNAKMKDSGIPWLGQIPEHWKVKKLKFLSTIITGNTPPKNDERNYSEEGIPWVKPDNLRSFKPLTDSKEKLSQEGAKKARIIPKNSVLVCCIGSVGEIGVAGCELTTNQQINSVVFLNKLVDSTFGAYSIFSSSSEYEANSNKVVVAIINKSKQSEICHAIPPLPEQILIAEYLNRETGKIDRMIGKVQESIDKLREYRTALISAAVTGKIDVREEVA